MDAEIIAIGSELLLGVTVDTNSSYLARQFAAAGITLLRTTAVGDNVGHIAAAIEEALQRADVVICTGGLGPTVDDVTRDAAAQALGRPLEFRQELLDEIIARFAAMQRPMSESNRLQAYVPQGALALANRHGTAPAFVVEDRRGILIVLPGVPREMRGIFEEQALPYLRDNHGVSGVILVRTFHVSYMGESVIGERVADLMRLSNPVVGISARHGRCELRVSASAPSSEEAEALIAPIRDILYHRLGTFLTGEEPLDQMVSRLLLERQLSLAIYEGVAAAPLYRALSSVPEGLAQVRGITIHPPEQSTSSISTVSTVMSKDDRASVAHAGAVEARQQWHADLGLGIATAQLDEPGFTTVSVALVAADSENQVTRRYDVAQPEGWEYVSNLALEMLRRYLTGTEPL